VTNPRLDHRPALAVLMAGIVGAQALGPVAVHGSAATLQTGGGAPVRGGTLTLLGQSDIVNLDTVSADFEPSNLLERMFARQLFAYPVSSNFADELKVAADVATEIPTMANGGITDGGRTYTIHVKQGVMWDTTPPRQVTSGDFVREFKMLCNPVSPVSDPGYFETTIVGMASYCDSFTKVSGTVAAVDAYEEGTALPGVSAPNPSTIVFKLVQPTSDFLNILALGFCSARPVEYMKYLPDGVALRQHTLSDGPYRITSYFPGQGFTLDRNPAWQPSTDPLRHAYVDKVVITEGFTAEDVQLQLEAGTADMEFTVAPPVQDVPGLEGSPDLVIGPPNGYIGTRMLVLNQYAGPFTKKLVREAAQYAVDKNGIVQLEGGPKIAAVADQAIIPGSTGFIPGYDPYPDNDGSGDPAKAKALLSQAGYPHGVTVKLLYSTLEPNPLVAQALQASLGEAGFNVKLVPVTLSAFFGSYLPFPSVARRDVWDLATARWEPEWFGNNGRTNVEPLFTDPGVGSTDYGGYSSPVTGSFVAKALAAPSVSSAAGWWSQAERQIMTDAATVPVDYQKWFLYHSSAVHGCSFWWPDLNCDPTNIWLSS
jgi:ABC-type transport system substrate-binding protein